MDHNRVCVWFDSGPTGTGAEIFYPKIPWRIAQEPNSRAPPHRPPGVRGVVLIFLVDELAQPPPSRSYTETK